MSPAAWTINQRRAIYALDRHSDHKAQAGWQPQSQFWRDYSSTANALPPAIRTSGLILALATEIARGSSRPQEDGHIAVLADLASWLIEWSSTLRATPFAGVGPVQPAPNDEVRAAVLASAGEVVAGIITADLRVYRVIEQETLAYIAWLKTLAKPLAPRDDGPDGVTPADGADGTGGEAGEATE